MFTGLVLHASRLVGSQITPSHTALCSTIAAHVHTMIRVSSHVMGGHAHVGRHTYARHVHAHGARDACGLRGIAERHATPSRTLVMDGPTIVDLQTCE